MSIKNVTYNNFDLQSDDFLTKDIIYRNSPKKTLDIEPLSRRDGFRVVNSFYSDKSITISGNVTADTEAALRTLIDNMKKALDTDEANLDIDDGGSTVRWVCSVENIDVPEQFYNITRLPYSISFKCQPFGKSTTMTTVTNSIVNTSSASNTIVITGSASPRPIIRWTVSGTPTTDITSISLVNNTTTDTITVASLALNGNGEYLEIDTDDMSVVQSIGAGEVEIDFTGVFPRFNTSTNSYSVTLIGGGASKTLNQSITYNASYL